MRARRLPFLAFALTAPLLAHVACSSTNGDPIPSEVFDASPLDAGGNPDDPDGGGATKDGGADAKADGAVDAGKDVNVAPAPIVINELYVDRIGDGDASEFVELRGTPGTPVDDLKLRLVDDTGKVKYEVAVGAAGDKIQANGLWVVGGGQTFKLNVQDHVDRTVATNVWGLQYPGAVQLVRGTTLVDVVGYVGDADAGAVPSPSTPPTATAEGKPAIAPDNAGATTLTKRRSFGRKTGAADTNDNRADFCAMEASPGYAQKPCL